MSKKIRLILFFVLIVFLVSVYNLFSVVVPLNEMKGTLYIFSVGIDDYLFLPLKGCVNDAKYFVNDLSLKFNKEVRRLKQLDKDTPGYKIIKYLLLNEEATRENIGSKLKQVAKEVRPDDYFIFFFAGFSDRVSNRGEIFFYPFLKSKEIKPENFITLSQFKNWIELIPARKQLIITEAGNTENFGEEFTLMLTESNPLYNLLTERNRVIITTNGCGKERMIEYNDGIKRIGGPLAYYLTELPGNSIFQIFHERKKKKVVHDLLEIEIKSGFFPDYIYSNVFFEKDFLHFVSRITEIEGLSKGVRTIQKRKKENKGKKEISKNYALIIATNKYEAPEWHDLQNPQLDAQEISNELKNSYGFETEILKDPAIKYLTLILKKYKEKEYGKNDQLLFFITGHGYYDDFFSDGLIVTRDSKPSSVDVRKSTYFPFGTLGKILDTIACKHIVIILDICFGGNFGELGREVSTLKGGIYKDVDREKYIARKMKYKTRLYLASGMKEVPDGYRGKHSPFARKIIEALRSPDNKYGIITIFDLFKSVDSNITEPILHEFGSSEPGSDFLFIRQSNK